MCPARKWLIIDTCRSAVYVCVPVWYCAIAVIAELSLNIVYQASKSFVRPDAGSQGMVKIGSEANIASMPGAMTSSAHSASAVNLAMTTSTPSLNVKSNNVGTTPTITVTNLVAVITDVRTLVSEVVDLACLCLVSLKSLVQNLFL